MRVIIRKTSEIALTNFPGKRSKIIWTKSLMFVKPMYKAWKFNLLENETTVFENKKRIYTEKVIQIF